MATPLTDSINALTQYANEVTGGSDTNLSDAVHTLASGYGGVSDEGDWRNTTKFMYNFQVRPTVNTTYPEVIKLSFANRSDSSSSFVIRGEWQDRGLRTVEVYDIPNVALLLTDFVIQNRNLDTVIFNGGVKVKAMHYAFNATSLKHIYGAMDVSECANTWALQAFDSTDLYDIEFVASTIKYNISFVNCQHLTDVSLVSIVNGLDENASSQTLTLHATPKARCSTLMGNNDNGTFVADAQGTMTLADFITTVKGWTLA